MRCQDCFKRISINNKSGFCRACFLLRKKSPKLKNAQEVKALIDEINSYKVDKKRSR